jgi:Domain of unknown function (DUF4398)
MTPMRRKIHALVVLLALAPAGLTARTPPAEVDAAARSLEAARAAGAETYAPLELRFAQERLSQARLAVEQNQYDAAQRVADESSVSSELATVKARLGKARELVDSKLRDNTRLREDLLGGAPSGARQP